MLLRFHAVEEVGRFSILKHKAEQFSKLSLVFARNGYGKSTLCAILRSISESQPNYITARRRLDAVKESRIQIGWSDGSNIAFGGGKWNSQPAKIYVFDQEFVHQNLHVGDSVTRDNKRNLIPVVLGEDGVKLAQNILDLDREQRDIDLLLKQNSSIVYASCPAVTSKDLLKFCQGILPEDIEIKIENARRKVQLAKQATIVRQRPKPRLIVVPTLAELENVLSRTISTISVDVALRVQEHINNHGLGAQGNRWLKYGLDHSNRENCPFCNQDIRDVDLIPIYEAYFGEAFAQLVTDRDAAITSIEALLSEGALKKIIEANDIEYDFWAQVTELSTIPRLDDDHQAIIRSGLIAIRSALEQKVLNPMAVAVFADDIGKIENTLSFLEYYNGAVIEAEIQIDNAKAETHAIDLSKSETIYQQWIAFAARRTNPVKEASENYLKYFNRKTEIGELKKTSQVALTKYADATMKSRQDKINELLSAFGANFKIANAKANFKGRDPNTEYAICIGERAVLAGDKSDTAPSFKTLLSAGDKTTLALALFITQICADVNIGNSVVVFDDPFNSQDMNRQFETTSQIRSVAGKASQTIVFSHDPRFLNMIEKDADKNITSTFQMQCSDNGEGTIGSWSSANELKELYVRQGEMIREFANQGTLLRDATYLSILQAIRPFLEDYIRARFPGRFTSNQLIVGMMEVIKAAGEEDPLYGAVDDLLALNEYSRINMHGGGQPPDPVALRAQAQKIIKIVGQY